MKLSKESIDKFKKLLDICAIANITSLIIEPDKVRGVNSGQTALLVQNSSIFDADVIVGLLSTDDSARIQSLNKKLSSVLGSDTLQVELIEDKKETAPAPISGFKISGSGAKYDFKASRIEFIKAPKGINDEMIWSFKIDHEKLKMLDKAAASFSIKNIGIVSKGSGEISLEITDTVEVTDLFSFVVADSAEWIGDGDQEPQAFVQYYDYGIFKALFKEAAKETIPEIRIGRNGIGIVTINGFDIAMLPREE